MNRCVGKSLAGMPPHYLACECENQTQNQKQMSSAPDPQQVGMQYALGFVAHCFTSEFVRLIQRHSRYFVSGGETAVI
jgi:hypothetical protein